jgi:hypothetical protein
LPLHFALSQVRELDETFGYISIIQA